MTHVITLQMSNQRIPRWLTEGISEYEETQARPDWGREMEIPFAMALERGKTLKLADLNSGFTRPDTIALAYYEASLLVDHIVRTYGEPNCRRWCDPTARGSRAMTRSRSGLASRFLSCRRRSTRRSIRASARCGRRFEPFPAPPPPARAEGRPAPLDINGLRAAAAGTSRQLFGAARATARRSRPRAIVPRSSRSRRPPRWCRERRETTVRTR